MYKDHLQWAAENRKTYSVADRFCSLAEMYTARPEHAALALIEACAEEIEKMMVFQTWRASQES